MERKKLLRRASSYSKVIFCYIYLLTYTSIYLGKWHLASWTHFGVDAIRLLWLVSALQTVTRGDMYKGGHVVSYRLLQGGTCCV